MSSGWKLLHRLNGRPRAAVTAALIGLFLLGPAVLSGGSVRIAAQAQPLTVKLVGFHAEGWSRAQAVVTVLDSTAGPASGLTKTNFAAQVNGTAVPTLGLSTGLDSSLPLVVVLALDVGAGMQGDGLAQAKLAASQFLDGLGPQDSVAVLAFSDAPILVQAFTQDRAAARSAIDGLNAGGGSAAYQATAQSVFLASAQADTGRRAIVLLSNHPDTDTSSRQEALFAAKALGVPVFTIGLGSGIDHAYLRELADVSSGQFTEASTPAGLALRFQDVSKLLRDQYVLTLDASGVGLGVAEPAMLHVQVSAGGSSGSDERLVCAQRVCIALSDIVAGEKVAKARTVTAEVVSAESVTAVNFLVDGKKASTAKQPPYQFSLDPKSFSEGSHTLTAEVEAADGVTRTGEMKLTFGAASGGLSPLFRIGGVVVALLVVGLLVIGYRRIRRTRDAGGPALRPVAVIAPELGRTTLDVPVEEPMPAVAVEPAKPLGRIVALKGATAGQTFDIGEVPVSVGSGQRCVIQVHEDPEEGGLMGSEFARVWIRGDHLVVHELRRITVSGPIGGQWQILGERDEFSIGTSSFRFELLSSEEELEQSGAVVETQQQATGVPNVLRDPSPADSPFPVPQGWPGVRGADQGRPWPTPRGLAQNPNDPGPPQGSGSPGGSWPPGDPFSPQ